MSFNDVATVSVKENDYRFQFGYISKDEAINLLKSNYLSKKVNPCKYNFLSCIKGKERIYSL